MNGPMCEKANKFIFWSEHAAKHAARQLVNANRAGSQKDRLRPYRCGGHFHIGHDMRPSLQRRKSA